MPISGRRQRHQSLSAARLPPATDNIARQSPACWADRGHLATRPLAVRGFNRGVAPGDAGRQARSADAARTAVVRNATVADGEDQQTVDCRLALTFAGDTAKLSSKKPAPRRGRPGAEATDLLARTARSYYGVAFASWATEWPIEYRMNTAAVLFKLS